MVTGSDLPIYVSCMYAQISAIILYILKNRWHVPEMLLLVIGQVDITLNQTKKVSSSIENYLFFCRYGPFYYMTALGDKRFCQDTPA